MLQLMLKTLQKKLIKTKEITINPIHKRPKMSGWKDPFGS